MQNIKFVLSMGVLVLISAETASAGFMSHVNQVGDQNGGSAPISSSLSLTYTIRNIPGASMTLGEASNDSALRSTPDLQKRKLSIKHLDPSQIGDGEIPGPFAVPAPGASALIGLAAMISSRRRRN